MKYKKRITDKEIEMKLEASGALLIRGPKSCGKTESAKQFANSILNVDQNEQVSLLMDISPQQLLVGNTSIN